ncbi:hemagglutinin repeat-containing protein [Pseudomonas fluorescens]|uniref:hemagglutinin repeat-containing protein n=1 Tax=Pseudomonas fluorescens TaxID=294 RepID=UPI00177BFA30|nr:hemagglutinin repeat-containing protein [Pseudomonas fluorescens]MBD8190767.1 hemagglutinin repeat-containing protein [Pseudomonas fluorescens]MBD8225393.1 hemagglutinin repeat-containing protein [Pseudomonas fluorescens]MBD8786183.1 hemagglutinin repeat-containing protein [Pseudomonas fluorescens]MBD8815938.1 hemagglutinin repeat-containing protein [Pseudomonas fluorescens]
MNKHLYRIVFNQARGLLMVVAENVKSVCKAPGTSGAVARPGTAVATLTPLRFALMLGMGWVALVAPVQAQVVVDGSAPAGQRPTIGAAGNGTTVVDITRPSGAGVSRNTYTQFDVDKRGVILNNGVTNSQTQLGGWIEGNRNLVNGSARVILNEVNSNNPSQLRGFVEVGGSKAQVVIANPSGITCEGCGFINADRATLTTGRAQFENGLISGYQVSGGKVSIGGEGMDASRADYTEIIARTVEVNAGIWSKDLTIKAGTTGAAPTDTPTVGIDVAQLGGMYAGKITLVGNGAGVGVRNAGQIGSSAGEVVIGSDGRIENHGQISSATDLTVRAAKGIDNDGTLYAQGNLDAHTAGDIDNRGIVSAQGNAALTATGANSAIRSHAGSALAAGVDSAGKLGSSGSLTLTSAGTLSAKGQNLAAQTLKASAAHVDLSDSQTSAQTVELTSTTGNLDLRRSRVTASRTLTADANQSLFSDAAQVGAAQISVTALDLSNVAGKWVQTGSTGMQMTVARSLDNSGGTLSSGGALGVSADTLNNAGGLVQSGGLGDLAVSARQHLNNQNGKLVTAAKLTLDGGTLDNSSGQITAGGALGIKAAQLNNANGTVAATQTLTVKTDSLLNQGGTLGSVAADLIVNSDTGVLNNRGGRLEAAKALTLNAFGLNNQSGVITGAQLLLDTHGQQLDNSAGTVNASDTLGVDSGALINDGGIMQAKSDLSVDTHGQQLSNRNSGSTGGILGQRDVTVRAGQVFNDQGFIGSARTLDINAQQLSNQAGLLRADGHLLLTAASVDNSATQGANQGIKGQSVDLDTDTLTNRVGSIVSDTTLNLKGSGSVDNDAGILSAGSVLTLADRNPAQKSLAINNGAGTLIAGQSVLIDSASYSGAGRVQSLGDLTFRLTQHLINSGLVQSNGDLSLQIGGTLSNQGAVQSGALVRVDAGAIDNGASGVISGRRAQVNAVNQFDNRGVVDGESTRLSAATLNNLGTGRLYGDHLSISAGTLNNTLEGATAATIAARNRLDIGAQVINNREHGLIFSAGDTVIGGLLDANDQASGQAQVLNNASATVEALGHLSVNARQINNTNEHFATQRVLVSNQVLQEFLLSGSTNRYTPDQISLYNDEVLHLVTPESSGTRWNRYDYTRSVTETQIVSSDPAQMLAGGNLNLIADQVLNDKSRIIAGQALNASGVGSVINTELNGERITTDSGTLSNFYRIQRKGRDRQGRGVTAYTPAPLIQQISLKPSVYTEYAAINGSGTQVGALVLANVTDSTAGTGALAGAGRTHAVSPISEVKALTQLDAAGAVEQIRTGGFNPDLPNSSLFQTNPNSTASYLVETDPRFANYRKWLSSDYMLGRLNLDPAATQQRLGDGFYEQKLIREQIAQLTGRRFLDGYASDEEQYRGMIDSAVTLAGQWKLIPGVALTAEQMAQLTSDIVWLVSRDVTLASGEVRQVLVPQVYVRVREGDLDGSGALMAGRTLNLDVRGDLVNSGSLSGRDGVNISVQNLDNLGGRIQGNNVALSASQDINNIGGLISANSRLALSAGNDINVRSVTTDSESAQGTRTGLSRVAGLYVSAPAASLIATAGNDINLQAAQVSNTGAGGKTSLVAGNDISLTTVKESYTQANQWDGDNWRKEAGRNEVGSSVQANGDIRVGAGRDVQVRGALVNSDAGAVAVSAVRDINVEAGERFNSADEAHKVKGSNGMFSSKTTTTRDTVSQTTAQASTFSGEQAVMQAGNNITVTGSNVVSTSGTVLAAGNDIKVLAATEQLDEKHMKDVKTSGMFSGGAIAVTVGSKQQTNKDSGQQTTAAASNIGATDGNVLISAGGEYRQVGSNVNAPNGDVSIEASEVNILEARNLSAQQQEQRFKQTGVSLTLTNPIVSAVQTAQRMNKAAERTDDKRMKTLAALSTAWSANDAYTQVMADPAAAGGINLSIALGMNKSESKSEQTSNTAAASTVAAGGDVTIVSSGGTRNNDLTVQGSEITAGNNALLKADGNILLAGAQNTIEQHSTNKSVNGSLGIGISFGSEKNGLSFNASASQSRGNADGNDLVWSNTHVTAGKQASLISGKDTTLRGAVVSGETVKADIGGNLNVESLQDTSTFASEQKSMSAGISICIPPVCAGAATASFSSTNAKQKSNFASVIEQSGIRAGDGGFDINVRGNTDLKGGVIASSDKAIADGKNSLTTGTLTVSDIHNVSEASAKTSGVDLSSDMLDGKLGTAKALLANSLNNGSDSDSESSDTRSAISAGTLVITNAERQRVVGGMTVDQTIANLNRNTEAAHVAVGRLDVAEMGRKVEAEQEIKREFYHQVSLLADEAYRKIFIEKARVYEVLKDENGKARVDKEGKVEYRELSDEEKLHLKKGPDNKVHIANNGIFNDADAAARYANQHSSADTGPQYLIHFEKANNFTSELMIAAYQKNLENDFWGLSNATVQTKEYMVQFGQSGLHIDGHSRGTMTTGNAMESLARDSSNIGVLGDTSMNFFGAAYGVQKADSLLGILQDRSRFSSEEKREEMALQYQNHRFDPVARTPGVGFNPGTGGTLPPGSNPVLEWLKVFYAGESVHNCYGAAGPGCAVYWKDFKENRSQFVKVKPQP